MTLVYVLLAERFPNDAQRLAFVAGVVDRVMVLGGTAAGYAAVQMLQGGEALNSTQLARC